MVNILPNPQTPSPWGIMVDANDPLTGEKISTSVNEWGHVLDIASQGTEDLLRWINGEITDHQIANGEYLRDWVEASKLGTSSYAARRRLARTRSSRSSRSIDTPIAKSNGLTAGGRASPEAAPHPEGCAEPVEAFGPSLNSTFEGARKALIGSEFETKLITPSSCRRQASTPARRSPARRASWTWPRRCAVRTRASASGFVTSAT